MDTNPEHSPTFICRPGPIDGLIFSILFCHKNPYSRSVTRKTPGIIQEYLLGSQKRDSDNPQNSNSLQSPNNEWSGH